MSLTEKLQVFSRSILTTSSINKYSIAIVAFVIWISFFDRFNLVAQYKLSQSVEELESKKANYEALLSQALVEREVINKDIEKYGREKYLFQKDNEEIILIK